MKYPERVKMVEVGPRDGLQNEPVSVSAEVKVALIDRLSDAGFQVVEAGSFVSPKWVPQMADTAEVMAHIRRKPGVAYPVLVPNMKGLEAAIAAKATEVAGFAAATEAFSKRNTNCTIAESMQRQAEVCKAALGAGLRVRGYISVVLGCPYEGEVKPEAVAAVSQRLYDMGCYEISLGDTIGTGTPAKAQRMIETVAKKIPVGKLAGHFHDTYGQALANILAVMELGVATIDSSVAGLVAARMRRARPATSPAKTCFTCSAAWASKPAWIWGSSWMRPSSSARNSSGRRYRAPAARSPPNARKRRHESGAQGHPVALCQCLPAESIHRIVPRLLSHPRRNCRLARFFRYTKA